MDKLFKCHSLEEWARERGGTTTAETPGIKPVSPGVSIVPLQKSSRWSCCDKKRENARDRTYEGEPGFTLYGFGSPNVNTKGVYVSIHPFARLRLVFAQNGRDSLVSDWYHSFRKSIASRYFLTGISL